MFNIIENNISTRKIEKELYKSLLISFSNYQNINTRRELVKIVKNAIKPILDKELKKLKAIDKNFYKKYSFSIKGVNKPKNFFHVAAEFQHLNVESYNGKKINLIFFISNDYSKKLINNKRPQLWNKFIFDLVETFGHEMIHILQFFKNHMVWVKTGQIISTNEGVFLIDKEYANEKYLSDIYEIQALSHDAAIRLLAKFKKYKIIKKLLLDENYKKLSHGNRGFKWYYRDIKRKNRVDTSIVWHTFLINLNKFLKEYQADKAYWALLAKKL